MAVTTLKQAQIRDGAINNQKVQAGAGIVYSKLDLTGGIVNADINASAAIALSKLAEAVIQADGGQAFTADQSMGGFKLTNLATPTAAGDAATKAYVDNLTVGLSWKDSVRVATTAAGTLATDFENGDTVDGVTLATNDRILIKNQAAPEENGIYVVNASGAPTRATDMDSWAEVPSAAVFVEAGTANADKGFNCTSNQGGTLGTTAITWVQFAGGGATAASAVSYDPSGNVVISGTNVQSALGQVDTAIGDRLYTENNVIADSETLTASLNKLDVAFGNLYDTTASSEGVTVIGDRAARYTNFTGGATLALTLTGIDTKLGQLDAAETPATETRTGSTSSSWVLSNTPSTTKGIFALYMNGARLNEGAGNDYTRSGATITFNITVETADVTLADYYY